MNHKTDVSVFLRGEKFRLKIKQAKKKNISELKMAKNTRRMSLWLSVNQRVSLVTSQLRELYIRMRLQK